MKKGRYLSERESEAIAAQYRNDTLFQLLRSLSLEAEEMTPDAQNTLSAEDLFYLAMGVIDAFLELGDPHDSSVLGEAEDAWLSMKQRLRNERPAMSDDELMMASTLVMLTVRECLRMGDVWRYWDVAEALANGTISHDAAGWDRLQTLVSGLWHTDVNKCRFIVWWQQYVEANGWLSDELDELLLKVRLDAPQTPDIEYKAEIISSLSPFFWNDEVRAERFLLAIYHKSDMEVTTEILRLKRTKGIDLNRKGQKLYNLLSSAKYQLYRASYQNFLEQLKE